MSMMQLAKRKGITVLVVGHINKEGAIAGPKVLEHMVDCVPYFEGDQNGTYRLLRAVKTALDLPMRLACLKWGKRACGRCRIHRKCFWQGGPSMRRGPALLVSWKVRDHCWPRFRHWSPKRPSMSPRRTANGFDFNRAVLLLAVLEKRGWPSPGNLLTDIST